MNDGLSDVEARLEKLETREGDGDPSVAQMYQSLLRRTAEIEGRLRAYGLGRIGGTTARLEKLERWVEKMQERGDKATVSLLHEIGGLEERITKFEGVLQEAGAEHRGIRARLEKLETRGDKETAGLVRHITGEIDRVGERIEKIETTNEELEARLPGYGGRLRQLEDGSRKLLSGLWKFEGILQEMGADQRHDRGQVKKLAAGVSQMVEVVESMGSMMKASTERFDAALDDAVAKMSSRAGDDPSVEEFVAEGAGTVIPTGEGPEDQQVAAPETVIDRAMAAFKSASTDKEQS